MNCKLTIALTRHCEDDEGAGGNLFPSAKADGKGYLQQIMRIMARLKKIHHSFAKSYHSSRITYHSIKFIHFQMFNS